MHLVYIHGANATHTTFNYIRSQLSYPDTVINYHSHVGFSQNLEHMSKKLQRLRDVFFVAHSLGGVYAMHLANEFHKKTLGAVTLSTPYGGSQEAQMAFWVMPHNQLIRDIRPHADPIADLKTMQLPMPWCNVVTTAGGSPFIRSDNDGVVTTDSMLALSDRMDTIKIDLNHFEVVLSDQVIKIISERIQQAS